MYLFFVIFTGLITLAFTVISAITGSSLHLSLFMASSIVFSLMLCVFAFIKKSKSRAFVPSLAAAVSILLYMTAMIISGFRQDITDFSIIYILLLVPAITLIFWAISLIAGLIAESARKS